MLLSRRDAEELDLILLCSIAAKRRVRVDDGPWASPTAKFIGPLRGGDIIVLQRVLCLALSTRDAFRFPWLIAAKICSDSSTTPCIKFKPVTFDNDVHIGFNLDPVIGKNGGRLGVLRYCYERGKGKMNELPAIRNSNSSIRRIKNISIL